MATKTELTLTRIFNAPRELVWRAWTDQQLVAQWWGPRGVTNPVAEVEPRVGGKVHIVMLAGKELGPMAGQRWPMKGTFTEIVPMEKLVYTAEPFLSEEEQEPFMEQTTTVTFEDQDGKTKMTLHVVVTKTTPAAEGPLSGMEMGWSQSLDKLGEFLAAKA